MTYDRPLEADVSPFGCCLWILQSQADSFQAARHAAKSGRAYADANSEAVNAVDMRAFSWQKVQAYLISYSDEKERDSLYLLNGKVS